MEYQSLSHLKDTGFCNRVEIVLFHRKTKTVICCTLHDMHFTLCEIYTLLNFTKFHNIWPCDLEFHKVQDHNILQFFLISFLKIPITAEKSIHNIVNSTCKTFIKFTHLFKSLKVVNFNLKVHQNCCANPVFFLFFCFLYQTSTDIQWPKLVWLIICETSAGQSNLGLDW